MKKGFRIEKYFVNGMFGSSGLVILLVAGILFTLISASWQTIQGYGFSFLTGTAWDPIFEEFGALPFMVGTLTTSFLALMISLPFSLSIALFLGEFHKQGKIPALFTSLVELLAGIPSVIYGFWALFYLVPIVRKIQIALELPPYGVGIFTASVILAIMIIPFSASIAREVIRMVPGGLKEGAYALGATRFEVIKDVVLPVGKSGIIAGLFLSLGRALGETMAVTMVIGNSNEMPDSLFAPGNTIASLLANEFNEASDAHYLSALMELGLVLFAITTVINLVGKWTIRRLGKA